MDCRVSHRLGLPLLYALHSEDPAGLEYLGKKTTLLTPAKYRRLNGILAKAIVGWKCRNTCCPPFIRNRKMTKMGYS
eukprot:scaffold1401_cov70-Cylindrotheca_fusiformis.AAC.3